MNKHSTLSSVLTPVNTAKGLPNAIALNNAGMNAARIVGPALAGLLIAVPWFGPNGVFYLSIPAVAWVFYSLLQIPVRGEPEPGRRAGFWIEFTTGLSYIRGTRRWRRSSRWRW